MDVQIHQVLTTLSVQRGGMTRNVLTRARLMAERYGRPVRVLVFGFSLEWDATCAEYMRQGLIDEHVEMVNMFDELAPAPPSPHDPKQAQAIEDSAPGTLTSPEGPAGHYAVNEGDRLVRRRVFRPGGTLARVEHLDDARRITRVDHYDHQGRLRRSDTRVPDGDGVSRMAFFDARGTRYIEIDYDPITRASTKVTRFGEGGAPVARYADEAELQIEWLRSHASRHERSIFHSDWWRAHAVLARVDHPGAAKVMTVHTNHLLHPHHYGAEVRQRALVELGVMDHFDAVVFLSRAQRDDVALEFGPRATYHVVNNFAPTPLEDSSVRRDPRLVVGVGRYHELKGWHCAIEAMRDVVARVPDAHLDLWGFGPEEERLAARIQELGLQDSVRLRGVTRDPVKVFAGAALSVITSPAEGFPLASLESMAAGTPVVAFNADYGLSDQIENGREGVLVPPGDTSALAQAVSELLEADDRRDEMGHRAALSAMRLSPHEYTERWAGVHTAALKRSAHRERLDGARATLEEIRRTTGGLALRGHLTVSGTPQHCATALALRPGRPSGHRLVHGGEVELDASGHAEFRFEVGDGLLTDLPGAARLQLWVYAGSSAVGVDLGIRSLGPVEITTLIDGRGRPHRRLSIRPSLAAFGRRVTRALRRRTRAALRRT